MTEKERANSIYSQLKAQFQTFDWNKEQFLQIAAYLAGGKVAMSKGMFPNKGLAVIGPTGCGKTALFRFLKKADILRFKDFHMLELESLFAKEGLAGLSSIIEGKPSYRKPEKIVANLFLDDVGYSKISRHYGDELDIFSYIIQRREAIMTTHSLRPVVYFTSNLNLLEFRDSYDQRVSSRLNSMFNVISFTSNSLDMRLQDPMD